MNRPADEIGEVVVFSGITEAGRAGNADWRRGHV
jgi:hypothetical protein